MKSGIYQIINTVNGKKYIGSSVELHKRRIKHFSALSRNKHKNDYLQASYNKYGKDSFTFEIVEECQINQLLEREQWYIDNWKPEYNICKEAGHTLGYKHTPETRQKISERQLGENNHNYGRIGDKHPMFGKRGEECPQYGKKRTDEVKQKMSRKKDQVKIKVYQFDLHEEFIREWNSATEAGRVLKIPQGNIRKCCINLAKTAGGYIWSYTNGHG